MLTEKSFHSDVSLNGTFKSFSAIYAKLTIVAQLNLD